METWHYGLFSLCFPTYIFPFSNFSFPSEQILLMIFKSVTLGFGEVVSFLVIIYLSKYFEYISPLVYYMDIA